MKFQKGPLMQIRNPRLISMPGRVSLADAIQRLEAKSNGSCWAELKAKIVTWRLRLPGNHFNGLQSNTWDTWIIFLFEKLNVINIIVLTLKLKRQIAGDSTLKIKIIWKSSGKKYWIFTGRDDQFATQSRALIARRDEGKDSRLNF